jgi:hypothetical protein
VSDDRYLSPKTIQTVGLALLVVFVLFWFITDRQSTLLVGFAGSLILLGRYEQAGKALVERSKDPTPPPIAKDEEAPAP